MPNATPSTWPVNNVGQGAGNMLCPTCNGDSLSERSSFKTATEPVLGTTSVNVIIDLMSCKRCGAELPAVRGKRRYALVGDEKLSGLLADLEEAQRTNSEMQGLLDALSRRAQTLTSEIERCVAAGEVSVMEEKVNALEAETEGMEKRRAKLAETLELMASKIPAA